MPPRATPSSKQLLVDLQRVDAERQRILDQIHAERLESRESEKFESFAEECRELICKFAFDLWEKQPSRHFDLHHIFNEEFKFSRCLKQKSENEIELRIPTFYDATNPGKPKVARFFFWILPSINQGVASALVRAKREELSRSLVGDGHRSSSITYVFLARHRTFKEFVKGGRISPGHFAFIGVGKNPKFLLSRLARICKGHALSQLNTIFKKLQLTEKGLVNPAKRAVWKDLTGTCKKNASLLLWSGAPLELSREITKTILVLQRLALGWEGLEYHSIDETTEGRDQSQFTIGNSTPGETIVNFRSSFTRKFRASENDPPLKRDKDGIVIEEW